MTAFRPFSITAPGVYDVPAADYHADRLCPWPTLSRGAAKTLLARSPRHAWVEHPRLNPDWQPEDPRKFDLGSAAHRLVLGGPEVIELIEASDYRTKEAQRLREEALAAGRLPVLEEQWVRVQAMERALRLQLAAHADAKGAFTAGKPEQTLVWQQDGVWCRARLDWLPDQPAPLDDLKTTGGSAEPDAWARIAFETGADLQDALYSAGAAATLGWRGPVDFRFVVQEDQPPYALSVVRFTPEARALAMKKLATALDLWRRCLAAGTDAACWPSYPARTCWISPPAWHEAQWLERENRAEALRQDGHDLKALLLHWQSPLNPTGEAA